MGEVRQVLGFDRRVRAEWLELAADLARSGCSPTTMREALRGALNASPEASESTRVVTQTLTILMRVWGTLPPGMRAFRDEALRLYGEVAADERFWLQWGMILATHRFVLDAATHAGRLLALQDDLSVQELHRRLLERWGDRSTVVYAVARVMANFVDWSVLARATQRGVYRATPRRTTRDPRLKVWMVEAWLRANGVPCASLTQIAHAPALFPFELDLVRSEMRRSSRLELMRQGMDTEMLALR